MSRVRKARNGQSKEQRKLFSDAQPMKAEDHVYHASRCFGKVVFSSRSRAMRAKRELSRVYKKKYRVYRCCYCGKWHLTTHQWNQ